jgi:DNA-binding HxlR family transcriptional regulator
MEKLENVSLLERYAVAVPDMMGIIRDKWSLLLMNRLLERPLRFSELRRRAEPITQKVLTHSLRSLDRHGLIERRVLATVPPQVHYSVTDLGRSFLKTVGAICYWTADNLEEIQAAGTRFNDQDKSCHILSDSHAR